jgi:cysteinyl-tRNA synthetase
MSAHYRRQLNFSFEGIRQADQALERIDNMIVRLKDIRSESGNSTELPGLIADMKSRFAEAVDNDLNISAGFAVFFDFITAVNTMISADKLSTADTGLVIDALREIDSVFGFIFYGSDEDDADSGRIDALVRERIDAKKNKDFARADEIRDLLRDEGIILEDTKDGTRWKRKKS